MKLPWQHNFIIIGIKLPDSWYNMKIVKQCHDDEYTGVNFRWGNHLEVVNLYLTADQKQYFCAKYSELIQKLKTNIRTKSQNIENFQSLQKT